MMRIYSAIILLAFVAPAFAETFTIVAIPDTQGYNAAGVTQPASRDILLNKIQWIVNNRASKNIVFVTHEGDMVNNITDNNQLNRALYAMDPIKTLPVPYSIVAGNHDYDTTYGVRPLEGSTIWKANFGYPSPFFLGKSWFGGYAAGGDTDGMTTYQTFTAAGINFLHIGLELDASDSRLAWAQSVINAHPGWPTIVTIHKWMSATGGGYYTGLHRTGLPANTVPQMWDEFVTINQQIFLILCGHSYDEDYHCSYRRTDVNNAGLDVYQWLADYQQTYSGAGLGGGGGWLRLMEVNTYTNTIRVRTYSTLLNKYTDDPSLTDGSSTARQWAPFNYDTQGTGALYAESNAKSSTFTMPFIYGTRVSRPLVTFGSHISGLACSIPFAPAGTWTCGGLAFDPSYKVSGNYDRIYFVNRVTTGTEGLYSASISQLTTSPRLALGSVVDTGGPYGCAVDQSGNAYVCYSASTRLWKVTGPAGPSPAETLMLGNYEASTDDDLQSVSMMPNGFGGGFDAGLDLLLVDSGIDSDAYEGVVALQSDSTELNPLYTIVWKDNSDFFTSDIKGCASPYDGYFYLVPTNIPKALIGGIERPYICRVKADGVMQRIFLSGDVTFGNIASKCDDSITVNPVNGSVWFAAAVSTSEGLTYPRSIARVDIQNAVELAPNDYLAPVTPELLNAYINIGINGMAWSPDGKYLALGCVDTDMIYVLSAAVPTDCADAISKGYGLAYDFNDDCQVNLIDFSSINIDQLAQFAIQWLECIDPQTCTWIWP